MLKKFMIIFSLLAFSIPVMAQELDETYSADSGFSLWYPTSYTPLGSDDFNFSAYEESTNNLLNVTVDQTEIIPGSMPTTLEEVRAELESLTADGSLVILDNQDIVINGQAGFGLTLKASDDEGVAYAWIYQAEDGRFAGASLFTETEVEGAGELLEAILASVVLADPDFVPAAIDPSVFMNEDGSIDVANLPRGMVYLTSGLNFKIPAGWRLVDVLPVLWDTAMLQSNATQSRMITVLSVDDGTAYEVMRDAFVGTMSLMAGHMDFDPETDFETHELTDGRLVDIYNSTDHVETLDVIMVGGMMLQDDGKIILIQNQSFDKNDEMTADEMEAAVLAIAESANFIEMPGAVVEDGLLASSEATCSSLGRDFVSETQPMTVISCPADCDQGSVWGTDIYTDDSSICTAALHASVIDASGGPVQIEWQSGQDSYLGSERNGVSTYDYGSWGASFTVSAPE